MATSQAWSDFIANLREAVQLLAADPSSSVSLRRAKDTDLPRPTPNVPLSMALTKGCVMLVSGRLQGCIESQTQEFLERLDQSRVLVEELPEPLRAELCARYFPDPRRVKADRAVEMHKRYAVLWAVGERITSGTIKTDSLPDRVWNPRPEKVDALMRRCDVALFERIEQERGARYLRELQEYVHELVTYRNEVAHGGEPALWTASDVILRIRWAARLARHCDTALGDQLVSITGQGW